MPFLTNKQGSRSHKNSINKKNIDKRQQQRETERQRVGKRDRQNAECGTKEEERKAMRESFYYFGTATDFAGTKMNLA